MRDAFAVAALQKLTTLDFPGLVSAMVYTQGCNFHCPYCHNRQLVAPGEGAVKMPDLLAFLEKRAGLLDGLVISGGEPTLQPGLVRFCKKVREIGYRIKLDSNGSRPAVLKALLDEGLIDYAAIDLKARPAMYNPALTTEPGAAEALARSLDLLRMYNVAHELRTTCVSPFVAADLPEEARPLAGAASWLLQRAVLSPEVKQTGLAALDALEMEEIADAGRLLGLRAKVRA